MKKIANKEVYYGAMLDLFGYLLMIIRMIIVIRFFVNNYYKFREAMDNDNNDYGKRFDIIHSYPELKPDNSKQIKLLINNKEGYNKLNLSSFPKIKVNNPVKNVHLIAEITFTDEFVRKYKYEDSKGYYFALNFFIGNLQNGGYYNVYRNQQGGVGNSEKQGLNGAKLAYLVNEGVVRNINLNNKVPVAVKRENWTPTYQFRYLKMNDYINSHIGEELPIGVFLSSTSEVEGYKLTRIKSLKLEYEGGEGDVEIIQPAE